MTVPTEVAFSGPYYPNGVTVAFPFSFKAISKDDLAFGWLSDDGTFDLIEPSTYTVTLAAEPSAGGTLTTTAPLAEDETGRGLYVLLDPDFTQNVRFEDEGAYNQSILNPVFDRAAMRSIWLKSRVDRAIILPFGDETAVLPVASERAGKFLAFDAVTGALTLSAGSAVADPDLVAIGEATLSDVLAVNPLQFGAQSNILTNDRPAIEAAAAVAFATGLPLDGLGRDYWISGQWSVTGKTAPVIRNFRLHQLSPSAVGAALAVTDCDGAKVSELYIDCGTYNTSGNTNSQFGFLMKDCDNARADNIEVTGKGKRSYATFWGNTRSIWTNICVRDCDYDDPAADDDVLQGIWLYQNTDCSLVNPRVWNLYGNSTVIPGFTHLFTRAIACGGNTRVGIINPRVRDADQGVDVTGGPANNYAVTVLGGHLYQCTQVGVKFANSAVNCRAFGVIAERCGTFGFGASGPTENDGGIWTQDIVFEACTAIDIGWNDFPTYARGFNCIKGDYNVNYPGGCLFINCHAKSTDGKMEHGFYNNVPYDAGSPDKFVQAINCTSQGHSVAAFSGMFREYCHLTKGSAQSIANNSETAITWGNEVEDTTAMHSTSSATDEILLRRIGTYRVRGTLRWAASSNGYRRAKITLNGSSVGTFPSSPVGGEETLCSFDLNITTTSANAVLRVLGEQTSGAAVNAAGSSFVIVKRLENANA